MEILAIAFRVRQKNLTRTGTYHEKMTSNPVRADHREMALLRTASFRMQRDDRRQLTKSLNSNGLGRLVSDLCLTLVGVLPDVVNIHLNRSRM